MSDASVLELSRLLREAPEDEHVRLRLVSALVRAGRRREAVARLHLAGLSDECFAVARPLANELWQAELVDLKRLASLNLDLVPKGPWVTFTAPTPGIEASGLAGGRLFAAAPGRRARPDRRRGRLLPFRGGVLASTRGSLTYIEWWSERGISEPETCETSGVTLTLEASPTGDRILTSTNRAEPARLHPWLKTSANSLEAPPAEGWQAHLLVDDQSGLVRVPPGAPGDSAELMARGWKFVLSDPLTAVRCKTWQGIWLDRGYHGWATHLAGAPCTFLNPSLASDGRSLRAAVLHKLYRFDLDTSTGAVRPTCPVAGGGRGEFRWHPWRSWWHPHADVLIAAPHIVGQPVPMSPRRPGPRGHRLPALVTAEGTVLKEFTGRILSATWTPDGLGLVLLTPLGAEGARLELWGLP